VEPCLWGLRLLKSGLCDQQLKPQSPNPTLRYKLQRLGSNLSSRHPNCVVEIRSEPKILG